MFSTLLRLAAEIVWQTYAWICASCLGGEMSFIRARLLANTLMMLSILLSELLIMMRLSVKV